MERASFPFRDLIASPKPKLKKSTSTINEIAVKSFLPKIPSPVAKLDFPASRKLSIYGNMNRLLRLEPLPSLQKHRKTERFCQSPISKAEPDDEPYDKELHAFVNQLERRRARDSSNNFR